MIKDLRKAIEEHHASDEKKDQIISNVSALSKGGFSMHTNPVIMIARC
jgi:hypothetical protein